MYEAKCIVMDYQHHNAQLQAQTQQHLQQLQSLAPDSTRWNQYQQFWRHQMLMNGINNVFVDSFDLINKFVAFYGTFRFLVLFMKKSRKFQDNVYYKVKSYYHSTHHSPLRIQRVFIMRHY